MKTLIVFYSLEGNTKFIAQGLSKAINADILELSPIKKYADSGFKKYFWGGKSVFFKEKPEIEDIKIDVNSYDNIIIGTPIWAGSYAPPINTFLDLFKLENKNIALLACHAGGGATKFYKNVKKDVPNNNFIGELDLVDPIKKSKASETYKDECLNKAIEWAKNLKL